MDIITFLIELWIKNNEPLLEGYLKCMSDDALKATSMV